MRDRATAPSVSRQRGNSRYLRRSRSESNGSRSQQLPFVVQEGSSSALPVRHGPRADILTWTKKRRFFCSLAPRSPPQRLVPRPPLFSLPAYSFSTDCCNPFQCGCPYPATVSLYRVLRERECTDSRCTLARSRVMDEEKRSNVSPNGVFYVARTQTRAKNLIPRRRSCLRRFVYSPPLCDLFLPPAPPRARSPE